jgi:hypothetical protein
MGVDRVPQPLDWSASDETIATALALQRRLHDEWRQASETARSAVEAVAAAHRDDQARRADAVAKGEPDPGARPTVKVEKAAEEAAERRDVLLQAYVKARARTLEVANEREDEWQQATAERLDAARAAVGALVVELDGRFDEYRAAWVEHAVAHDSRARAVRMAKVTAGAPALPNTLDGWRALAADSHRSRPARVA